MAKKAKRKIKTKRKLKKNGSQTRYGDQNANLKSYRK